MLASIIVIPILGIVAAIVIPRIFAPSGCDARNSTDPLCAGAKWLEPNHPALDWAQTSLVEGAEICEAHGKLFQHALGMLSEISLVPIDRARASSLAEGCDVGEKNSNIYLARAVKGHFNGGYELLRAGNSLVVRHSSLGQSSYAIQSAVVVSLPFVPSRAIPFVSVAE